MNCCGPSVGPSCGCHALDCPLESCGPRQASVSATYSCPTCFVPQCARPSTTIQTRPSDYSVAVNAGNGRRSRGLLRAISTPRPSGDCHPSMRLCFDRRSVLHRQAGLAQWSGLSRHPAPAHLKCSYLSCKRITSARPLPDVQLCCLLDPYP